MFKRLVAATAVVVSLGCVGASSASATWDPSLPFAGGAFEVVGGNQDVYAGLYAKGNTTKASGFVALRADTIDPKALFVKYVGAVDCVYTVGNQAWVSGKITAIGGPAAGPSKYFLWSLEDNGPAGGDPKDRVAFSRSPQPFNCRVNLETARDILRGDITVRSGSVTTQQ